MNNFWKFSNDIIQGDDVAKAEIYYNQTYGKKKKKIKLIKKLLKQFYYTLIKDDKYLFYSLNDIFIVNRNQYFYTINSNNTIKKKILISPFKYNDNENYQNLRYVINFSIQNLFLYVNIKIIVLE